VTQKERPTGCFSIRLATAPHRTAPQTIPASPAKASELCRRPPIAVIEKAAAPEIVLTNRGILGWETELLVTKPVSGDLSLVYYRSIDKEQEPFTLPANLKGALGAQRCSFDATESVINWRIGSYLAGGVALDSSGTAIRMYFARVVVIQGIRPVLLWRR
jgi:hypothetical protein